MENNGRLELTTEDNSDECTLTVAISTGEDRSQDNSIVIELVLGVTGIVAIAYVGYKLLRKNK